MSVAPSLEESFHGQGRCRKKKTPAAKLPSHYQFAQWHYEDGKRYAMPACGVKADRRAEFPLISTAVKNESTQTETLIWLHFDLDFVKADKRWRLRGQLDWPSIGAVLKVEVPSLFKYLTAVTRSSGGKGLALALAISPLELIDETTDIQRLAYRLQGVIISILNYYNLGADESARGLKRLMPNLFQEQHILDRDEVTEAIIQKKRPRVIQNLLYELRYHAAFKPQSKRDRKDILWPDIRVELPCARLYTDLLDSVGPWGTEQKTARELISRYGISKNTVYKLFSDPPGWLGVEHIRGEGYRLTIRPCKELTDRAYHLLEDGGEGRLKVPYSAFDVPAIGKPEEVMKGDRNRWLVATAVACKWKGIERAKLERALKMLVRRVPDFRSSKSLTRNLGTILLSIYRHRRSSHGCNPGLILPDWLSEALDSKVSKETSQNFIKKGTSVAGSQERIPDSMPGLFTREMHGSYSGLCFALPAGARVIVELSKFTAAEDGYSASAKNGNERQKEFDRDQIRGRTNESEKLGSDLAQGRVHASGCKWTPLKFEFCSTFTPVSLRGMALLGLFLNASVKSNLSSSEKNGNLCSK